MTSRQARTARREAERKAAKLAAKQAKSASLANPIGFVSQNANPEHEFSPELIAEANAAGARVHARISNRAAHELSGFPESGFVSQTTPQPSKRAEINRANAQHSSGPKSPEGKLASSRNSLKHGLASGEIIIPGEDPAAFEALLHDLLEEHQPGSPTEELLINEMAQSYWLTQRALRLQNDCFTGERVDEKRLSLFLRYQTTHERAFHKALNTLMKLRRERSRGFVSQPASREPQFVRQNHSKPLEFGFVPQNQLELRSDFAPPEEAHRPETLESASKAA